MHAVLALDTATDACSVGYAHGNRTAELHRIIPRAHNRHILSLIDDVLDGRPLDSIDTFACGVGPGSFTGLRIATSVIQGLAWSLDKPVMAMCSLELQVMSFLAERQVIDCNILSVIDAQIGQLYWRWFRVSAGVLSPLSTANISAPVDIMPLTLTDSCLVIGSGAVLQHNFSPAFSATVENWLPEVQPRAGVLARWAVAALQSSVKPSLIRAAELTPHYVQETIGWKKLSEQPQRV